MNSDSEEEEERPDWIAEPPHTTVLLVGRSGSGKSTLAKFILAEFKKYKKPIKIVNDHLRATKHEPINWENIAGLRDCALVIEDVISATNQQFKILQYLLNFKTHHDRVNPVLLVAHSLTKNNIFGILNSLTHIYVTACKANIASFRRLLEYFGFPQNEKDQHLRTFRGITQPFQHFCFDVEKMTFELKSFNLNDLGADDEEAPDKNKKGPGRRAALAMSKAVRFLSVEKEHSEKKMALFELVYPGLPPRGFNPKDLTVKLRTNKKTEVRVSLIDYITCLVSEQARTPPALLLQFHAYLRDVRNVVLPSSFILNKAFKQ
jgi:ABC-type oligopeptide transport system ATPase subunit